MILLGGSKGRGLRVADILGIVTGVNERPREKSQRRIHGVRSGSPLGCPKGHRRSHGPQRGTPPWPSQAVQLQREWIFPPPRELWYVASRRWEGQEEAGETGRSPSGCFLLGKTFHDARELWFSILSNPILPKRAKGFSSFFPKSFQCLF